MSTRNLLLIACSLLACSARSIALDTDPQEPVFWEICYDALGEPQDYSGDCDGAREIDWGTLPVAVYVDPAYPDKGRAVLQAIKVWNTWLGTDVFKPVTDFKIADVYVVQLTGNILTPAGYAKHTLVNDRPVFSVVMYDSYATNTVIVVHELGHVMGLRHDPGRTRSIMHPAGEWYVPWITRKDCRALRTKYKLPQEPCNA